MPVGRITYSMESFRVASVVESVVALLQPQADARGITLADVDVADTGRGIPDDEQQVIFDAFVQLGRSLTSSHEGTGLGLSISRDLARGMNGDLRVESRVDHGSTFTLELPAGCTSPGDE